MSLITELKRRNVFRVGIAYIVVAWLVIQVSDVMIDNIGAPDWVFRTILFVLVIGFPVAIVLAWAYELTPEGLKREHEVDRTHSITPRTGRKLDLVIIGVLVVAVAWLLLDRFGNNEPGQKATTGQAGASPESAATKTAGAAPVPAVSPDGRKAVAVLPFVNLSTEEENAFFAAGVHEDILTYLSRIAGLRVNSRTSVQQYAGSGQNLREVALALGAAYIVEGSVRRSGNRVRVTAQLIDASTDEHLWADNFDRELTDVFEIQTQVAQEIVAALEAELSPRESAMLARRPTESIEAYDLFLKARQAMQSSEAAYNVYSPEANALLRQAVAIDPGYAQAWAVLSVSMGDEYWFGEGRTEADLKAMKDAADRAMALQANLPEAHLALASYYYRGHYDYPRALEHLEIARGLAPSDTMVLFKQGMTLRRLGRYSESVDALAEAVRLDPMATDSWAELLQTASESHDRERFQQALQDMPPAVHKLPRIVGEQAWALMHMYGNLDAAAELLAQAPDDADNYHIKSVRWQLAFWSRDFRASAELMMHEGLGDTITPAWGHSYAVVALLREGAEAEAQALLEKGLEIATAAAQAERASNYAWPHMALARLLILAGRATEAKAACARARAILPLEKDKIHGVVMAYECAWVQAMAGETEAAMDTLDELFQLGWSLTPWELALDPCWDFLRGNQRFDALATPTGEWIQP